MADKSTILDSIKNEDCFTIEDIADELGVGPLRARQVIAKALDEKLIQNLVKKEGRRILYSPQMIEQLRDNVAKGRLGTFRKKSAKVSLKNAVLVINVPIFDPEIAKLLTTKFENVEGIGRYLKTQLESSVGSILARKKELEERFEREVQKLFSESAIGM